MIVRILGEVWKFNKETDSLDTIISTIANCMEKRGVLLSHLNIDGVEINEGFDTYLQSNFENIEIIEVHTKSLKDILDEMVISAKEYLHRAIPAIYIIINEFYHEPTKNTWLEFNNFLEGLQWIMQLSQTLNENPTFYSYWDQSAYEIEKFTEILSNLEEGLVNTDPILIADVLNYEVVPFLNSLKSTIDQIAETEVIPLVRN